MFQEKSTLCLLFSYMKRTVCSFMSFKKSQHTNPGKKDLKHTERSKTHHDIFSFALNSEFGTFFLVWMLPQAPESLSLIGSLQCSLLHTIFFRPLESFSIYSIEYIRLSALESWCLQKVYLSSAGGTGCQFLFGVSCCSKESLCGLSTSHI